jgi:hypothetical protein
MSYFSLWQMSSESEVYFGFTDGTTRHTHRFSSVTWVIFTCGGQLLCLFRLLGEQNKGTYKSSWAC